MFDFSVHLAAGSRRRRSPTMESSSASLPSTSTSHLFPEELQRQYPAASDIDNDSSVDNEDSDNDTVDDNDSPARPLPTTPSARHSSSATPPIYRPALFATHPHLAVLPVLLLEFLALALTRAVLPSLLLTRYEGRTYMVMGSAECVRGILAFFACPLFGKLSDVWGRKKCLFVTVLGTLAPVCSLAFWRVDVAGGVGSVGDGGGGELDLGMEGEEVLDGIDAGDAAETSWYRHFLGGAAAAESTSESHNDVPLVHRIDVFVILFALSGMFSSTFTLTFAYISDVVKDRDGRVAAYGLALATFGLSFTIGPLLGGYLANVNEEGEGQGGRNWKKVWTNWNSENGNESDVHDNDTHAEMNGNDIHPWGQHRVFVTTLILAVLDLFYIHFILPESLKDVKDELEYSSSGFRHSSTMDEDDDDDDDLDNNDPSKTNKLPSSTSIAANASESNIPLPAAMGTSRRASSSWWNPFDSLRYLTRDPLLSTIGRVTFFYYTALHAVVSTLILYAARQFHLGPHRLGELMAALGLSTMISEAVLVRIAIPALGEKRAMRVGLASFALQCILLAVAESPWQLYLLCVMAIPGNMVYPSVSSLVSGRVRPEMVGRALGAVNGVKSLTEGVGPLLFGTLLTMSENDALPGWPYFIAAAMAALAYQSGRDLPGDDDDVDDNGGNSDFNFYMTNKQMTKRRNRSMDGEYSLQLREEHQGLIDGLEAQEVDSYRNR